MVLIMKKKICHVGLFFLNILLLNILLHACGMNKPRRLFNNLCQDSLMRKAAVSIVLLPSHTKSASAAPKKKKFSFQCTAFW